MPQALDGMGKSRVWPTAMVGGPNAPDVPWPGRVSATRHGGAGKKARLAAPGGVNVAGAKYPLMSTTTFVLLVANTLTAPLLPAGTMAALATMSPPGAFKVDARGRVCPAGHTVRKLSGPD